MNTNHIILSLGAVAAIVATTLAWPSQDTGPVREARIGTLDGLSRAYLHSYNLPAHGVAIEGYSPVSYFSGEAEPGSEQFAVENDSVTYWLTSAAQVEAFRANPDRYVPAYGGWCAFGMSVEDKFPIDPTNFKIVDDRLLLFLKNRGVDALGIWNGGDESSLTKKAGKHWNKVRG